MKKLIIKLALYSHGWRPCKLSDGSNGWEKRESPTFTRRGPIRYAVQNLLSGENVSDPTPDKKPQDIKL